MTAVSCPPIGRQQQIRPPNKDVWTPPSEMRGDIARALLYMAVRYDGSVPGELDLELSDNPKIAEGQMGLLSPLLKWHSVDPPSSLEATRNNRVCSLYQHNRNPFVDHPEFVPLIWAPCQPRYQL
ncbi:hypothetical protein CLOP_g12165 [Closterium sp. NIES-67]|nr:hypothetical protein CLOP_g12165 [Closterium sp. NIES-67]